MRLVDETPSTITHKRVLTSLVGGWCASATDVVAEYHGLVAREPRALNLDKSALVCDCAHCDRRISYTRSPKRGPDMVICYRGRYEEAAHYLDVPHGAEKRRPTSRTTSTTSSRSASGSTPSTSRRSAQGRTDDALPRR